MPLSSEVTPHLDTGSPLCDLLAAYLTGRRNRYHDRGASAPRSPCLWSCTSWMQIIIQGWAKTHDPAPSVSYTGVGVLLRPQRLASAGSGAPFVQNGVAARGWGHEDPVSVLDHLLDIVESGVEPTVRHIVCLTDVQDLLDSLEHVRMVVLTWMAQLLGEVALASEDDADAGDRCQHLREVADPLGALDHQAAEQLALRVQGPHIGPGVILLLGNTPVGDSALGGIAPAAERLAQWASLDPGIAHSSHGVIRLFDCIDVG